MRSDTEPTPLQDRGASSAGFQKAPDRDTDVVLVVWDGREQARSGHGTASGSAKKSPRWFRSRWQDCGGVQECLAV